MRAMRLADSSESPKLVEATLPQPQPGPGEVLIRVSAAGTIRTELGWYPHTHDKSGAARQNAIHRMSLPELSPPLVTASPTSPSAGTSTA